MDETTSRTPAHGRTALKVDVVDTLEGMESIREPWDRLVRQTAGEIDGIDVTGTFDWTRCLIRSRSAQYAFRIVIAVAGGELVGILPLCKERSAGGWWSARAVQGIHELYSGRTGYLVDRGDKSILQALYEQFRNSVRGWDAYLVQVVDDSASAHLFQELVAEKHLPAEVMGTTASPYIELRGSWDEYYQSLDKKFRYNLRSREQKLNALGALEYQVVESGDGVDAYLAAMWEIEQKSWKESAATSITTHPVQRRFYEEFTPIAARNGWLFGTCLTLDRVPIAYSYSVLFENICYSLKSSFRMEYQAYSPGNVLRRMKLEDLCRRGVRYYDMMGNVDPHKLRWTGKTYHQSLYVVYNDTLRGYTSRLKRNLAAAYRRSRSGRTTS